MIEISSQYYKIDNKKKKNEKKNYPEIYLERNTRYLNNATHRIPMRDYRCGLWRHRRGKANIILLTSDHRARVQPTTEKFTYQEELPSIVDSRKWSFVLFTSPMILYYISCRMRSVDC